MQVPLVGWRPSLKESEAWPECLHAVESHGVKGLGGEGLGSRGKSLSGRDIGGVKRSGHPRNAWTMLDWGPSPSTLDPAAGFGWYLPPGERDHPATRRAIPASDRSGMSLRPDTDEHARRESRRLFCDKFLSP